MTDMETGYKLFKSETIKSIKLINLIDLISLLLGNKSRITKGTCDPTNGAIR